jgi:hypothetical protein
LSRRIDGRPDTDFFHSIQDKGLDREMTSQLTNLQIYSLPGVAQKLFFEDIHDEKMRETFI